MNTITEYFNEQEQQEIIKLIAEEKRRNGIPTIERVKETCFFDWHNNTYDGYFVWAKYPDGIFEIFFVVDLRSSLADYNWFIENIT